MKTRSERITRSRLGIVGVAFFCFALPGLALAEFPAKPINLIVPWAAGGNVDIVWRALAEPMGKVLGQPVVVTNKPGGAGTLGAVMLKNAAPDGYTVGHISSTAHIMNPYLFDAGYELKDLIYIHSTVGLPNTLIVKADSPWRTFQELKDYIKANPMKLRMGFYGVSGPSPIAMQWIAKKEGLKIKEVIFKGDAPGYTALLGDHVDALCSAATLIPHVKSGQLRMLLAFTSYPIKGFEDVPLFKSLYGKIIDSNMGLAGPKDLPAEIVAKYEDAIRKSMKDANFLKLVDSLSTFTIYMNHKEFTAFMKESDQTIKEWLDELGMSKK
jgi:tripartite-type tricarboxylate transporter receptor subunit TctC